jgi:hypothetical protein
MSQIDGIICHCTAFNPVPSLSAAVVNHFKFKHNIMSYNLAGMGCAASIIAVDLAKEIIHVRPRAPHRGASLLIQGSRGGEGERRGAGGERVGGTGWVCVCGCLCF